MVRWEPREPTSFKIKNDISILYKFLKNNNNNNCNTKFSQRKKGGREHRVWQSVKQHTRATAFEKLPGDNMSPKHRQSPPSEHLHSTKRKRTLKFEQLDENINETKSQTVTVTETETLTWKPDQCRNPPTSNRFEPIRSSRNRHKRRKRKHKSVQDDHRQWTFSSHDISKFKGTIFGQLISRTWNRY